MSKTTYRTAYEAKVAAKILATKNNVPYYVHWNSRVDYFTVVKKRSGFNDVTVWPVKLRRLTEKELNLIINGE